MGSERVEVLEQNASLVGHSVAPSYRSGALVVGAVIALVAVPFLNKPFHIDDPFILYITANVLANPLDPFAGEVDWLGWPIWIFDQATNPPLISYYLAPFAALSDYSELVLHAAMLPFSFSSAAA